MILVILIIKIIINQNGLTIVMSGFCIMEDCKTNKKINYLKKNLIYILRPNHEPELQKCNLKAFWLGIEPTTNLRI